MQYWNPINCSYIVITQSTEMVEVMLATTSTHFLGHEYHFVLRRGDHVRDSPTMFERPILFSLNLTLSAFVFLPDCLSLKRMLPVSPNCMHVLHRVCTFTWSSLTEETALLLV